MANGSKVVTLEKAVDVPFDAFGRQLMISLFHLGYNSQRFDCILLHPGQLYREHTGVVPVRIHSSCLTSEVFRSASCDCAWQLQHAVDYIFTAGSGVVIYLPWQEGRGIGLMAKIRSFPLILGGLASAEAFKALGYPVDMRDYEPAVHILRDLAIARVALITNNPAKIHALELAGIVVAERIPSIVGDSSRVNAIYLNAKARQGHLL
jgi:GTP cyclohydrolase II